MAKQIVGWVLITLGVLIMLWAGWRSYEIFTGKNQAPEIFKTSQVETIIKQQTEQSAEEKAQEQMQQAITQQLSQLLPAESIAKTINLGTWSILVFILIYLGSKIAGLGIKLLSIAKKKANIDDC